MAQTRRFSKDLGDLLAQCFLFPEPFGLRQQLPSPVLALVEFRLGDRAQSMLRCSTSTPDRFEQKEVIGVIVGFQNLP